MKILRCSPIALLALVSLLQVVTCKHLHSVEPEESYPQRVKFEDDGPSPPASSASVTSPVETMEPKMTSGPVKKFYPSKPDITEEILAAVKARKPDKYNKFEKVAPHPYTYEDSSIYASSSDPLIDTFPYMPSVKPSYIPPILQGNSKVDVHLGSDPLQHYAHHATHHGAHPVHAVGHHHDHRESWRKLVKVLSAAVPIVLFLAALPPNVMYVNATQMSKPLAGVQRQRADPDSSVQSFPVLDLIERLGGLPALEHPGCEARIFCEMARLGASNNANSVQQTLWSMANETPDVIADFLGARDLLKAIRTDACSLYDCPKSLETSSTPPPILESDKN